MVISPRSGQTVRTSVVRIVVHASDRSGAFSARLNGQPIDEDFGSARHGLRTLEASLSEGLRNGRNVLRVTVQLAGRRARTVTQSFVVRVSRPLVGAGPDRRVTLGSVLRLDGRVVGGDRAERATVRWQPLTASGRPERLPLAGLTNPGSLTTMFAAKALGRQTLRLTVGTGKSAVSDSVTMTVVPNSPLVAVNTMASKDGRPAISVGGDVYVAPPPVGTPLALIQVLVLDRATLKFVSNTTYTDTDVLDLGLRQLDAGDLVIAALRKPTVPGNYPYRETGSLSLAAALARIGFPSEDVVGGLNARPGDTVSAIGVPGIGAGEADVDTNPAGAAMTGYLTPDEYFEYRYLPPDLFTFTQPTLAPTCSTDCDVGFVVSDIDPYSYANGTFVTLATQKFVTNPPTSGSANRGDFARQQLSNMSDYLNSIPAGHLVRIQVQSHLAPGQQVYLPPISSDLGYGNQPQNSQKVMDQLAQAVASVGGTRNGFNRAALANGPAGGQSVYALLGWAGAGEGNGAEAAVGVDGAGSAPTLTVTLRRNRLHMFRPVHMSAAGPLSDSLDQLVLQAPQPEKWWPAGLAGVTDADKAGLARALAYIGWKGGLTCNPRAEYWTQFEMSGDVMPVKDAIDDKVKMPSPGDPNPCTGMRFSAAGFTTDQFTAAKSRLDDELDWVVKVRILMDKRSAPFDQDVLKDWAAAQDIADTVYKDAQNPKGEATFSWLHFTQIILKLLGPATGGLTSEASDLIELGVWVAGTQSTGKPSGDEVRFQADALGTTFVAQAEATQATFRQLGDIIISDPVKLETVGSKANCNAGLTCPPEYQLASGLEEAKTAATFYRAVERTAYEQLLPLGYRLTFLNPYPDNRTLFGGPKYGYPYNNGTATPDLARYDCQFVKLHPFSGWPSLAADSLLQVLSPDNQADNQWQPMVLTAIPDSTDTTGTPPPDALLKRMFDPVPRTNDPKEGGLGMQLSELSRTANKIWGWQVEAPGMDPQCTWDIP